MHEFHTIEHIKNKLPSNKWEISCENSVRKLGGIFNIYITEHLNSFGTKRLRSMTIPLAIFYGFDFSSQDRDMVVFINYCTAQCLKKQDRFKYPDHHYDHMREKLHTFPI